MNTLFAVGDACAPTRYTLAEMLAANADDEALCEWLKSARVGDEFDSGMGEPCRCVAETKPPVVQDYREPWRDRPDHDMTPWGSDLRSSR